MKDVNLSSEVPAVKDEDQQHPIPTTWRSVFRDIVNAFVSGDYQLNARVFGVESIAGEMARHIQNGIQAYGATLIDLPEETWSTSVCMWMGNYWDVLVDLWTKEEGQSDLVLSARVTETGSGYAFKIHMVYVP